VVYAPNVGDRWIEEAAARSATCVRLMPRNNSPFALAMEQVSNTIRTAKKDSEKAPQLRFDQEQLSKPEYLQYRWDGMSKLERTQYVQQNGIEATLKHLEGKRPNATSV